MPIDLLELLTPEECDLILSLDSPPKIQAFLDTTQYSAESRNRSVINVLRDRKAHCLDGGLFAASMLRRLGYLPVIVDMLPEPDTDDDHILAIFKWDGHYGAVAKSNFVTLRYREPVYRSIRELVMTYFDVFYNVNGIKTLRGYTRPVNLARLDFLNWETSDAGVDEIEARLYKHRPIPIVNQQMIANLTRVDEITYQAGMLIVNREGLYKPKVE